MRNRITYGYALRDGVIQTEREQKETVLLIFQEYLSGRSISQIAHSLNERKIPSPNGGNWAVSAVGRILKNKRYLGDDLYPSILRKDDFERAAAVREETAARQKKGIEYKREKTVYDGRIFCAECGGRYWNCKEKRLIRWRCSVSYGGLVGKSCENTSYLTDEKIELEFIKLVNRMKNKEIALKEAVNPKNQKKLNGMKKRFDEIRENMEEYDPDSIADLILWIAQEQYRLTADKSTEIIREAISEKEPLTDFDTALFQKIVKKVIVSKDGELWFELINGQKSKAL